MAREGRSQELRAIIDKELGKNPAESEQEDDCEDCDCDEWGDDVSQVLKILNDKIDIAVEGAETLDDLPAVEPYSDDEEEG